MQHPFYVFGNRSEAIWRRMMTYAAFSEVTVGCPDNGLPFRKMAAQEGALVGMSHGRRVQVTPAVLFHSSLPPAGDLEAYSQQNEVRDFHRHKGKMYSLEPADTESFRTELNLLLDLLISQDYSKGSPGIGEEVCTQACTLHAGSKSL